MPSFGTFACPDLWKRLSAPSLNRLSCCCLALGYRYGALLYLYYVARSWRLLITDLHLLDYREGEGRLQDRRRKDEILLSCYYWQTGSIGTSCARYASDAEYGITRISFICLRAREMKDAAIHHWRIAAASGDEDTVTNLLGPLLLPIG